MQSLWNEQNVEELNGDLLKLRVYTSRLLGKEEDLVMHGGGNTSVKIKEKNYFGEEEHILYVKGSGWDLATIETEGFAPVKMDTLLKMAELPHLADSEMVRLQRSAMTDPSAPNPSVEAILHAIIPFIFVDHTHADAVVTITNTPNGTGLIYEIYGDEVLVIPYVMPGFILAREIYERTKDVDWSKYKGMILLNHGVFTFNDDPKLAYENMIELVSKAEKFLEENTSRVQTYQSGEFSLLKLAEIRHEISKTWKQPVLLKLNQNEKNSGFSRLSNVEEIATRGPITPDHIIRTKQCPAIFNEDPSDDLKAFINNYKSYFEKHAEDGHTMLDPLPRWAIWKNVGTIAIGRTLKENKIIEDINNHTIKCIQQAEQLGGWTALPEKDLFEMEYWELEQAKLKKAAGSKPAFQGKIVLVTGAASGIGKACAERFRSQGAVVAALDINPHVELLFNDAGILGITCDVTNSESLKYAIEKCVETYGGLDVIVCNAGLFTSGQRLKEMDTDTWGKSLDINLTSHQQLISFSIPYLELGIDSNIIIVGSKNVPAPGPGAAAYSVAKAGLTQLARVAAMELGDKNIRINTIHPNAVYDTALWNEEVLKQRANHYKLSVEDYKKNNLLKTEITSDDVAKLACSMASDVFAKTTGAQIPIDGGNERVI